MQINLQPFYYLSLRFKDPDFESRYQENVDLPQRFQMRFAVFLAGFLYALYAFIDIYSVPLENRSTSSLIHLFHCVLFWLMAFSSIKLNTKRFHFGIVTVAFIVASINYLYLTIFLGVYLLVGEVYLMITWLWLVSGFSFYQAVKANLTLFFSLNLAFIWYSSLPFDRLIVHEFYIVGSMIMGALTAYILEYYKRVGFISFEEATKSQKLAEKADQSKSDFLANMSHEIRTPMNAIIGLTDLALQTDLSEKQEDYLQKVGNAGNSLLGIINDILDISKIEAGMLKLEKIPVNL